jgi:DNA-binding response OmpR family regulator
VEHAEGERFRVLLVERDAGLAAATAQALEALGFLVTACGDGRAGLAEAVRGRYDVVAFGVALPRLTGLEACRALRARSAVPILLLTARGALDAVRGLEAGADDALGKPFSLRELAARLRALVRRARGALGPPRDPIRVGALELSPRDRAARLAGRELALTTSEFALLRVLAERAGCVLSREELLDLTKGSAEAAFDRSIDARVSRLRQKLGDAPRRPRLLKTVRGEGYLLAPLDGEPPTPA